MTGLLATTIFSGALLLFLVQPLVGKLILPWFGGAAAVWTTCLLFFQVTLLLGYLYAYWTARLLRPRAQMALHVALIALAHLGHGPAVYHLTDQEHHHLVCERCGTVVEVPDQTLAPLSRRLKDEYGFSLRPRHFAMAGLCRSCRA